MKRVVRRLTKTGYQRLAKPLLFKAHPDDVHQGLTATAKVVQKLPGVRALPGLWAYSEPALRNNVMGIEFANPVGLSAGFDKKIEMPRTMKTVGFGWMTGGSVTWGACRGNDGPWYYRLPKSKALVVNAGLPSEGTRVVAKRVADYKREMFGNFPLNVSVAMTNSRETATTEDAVQDYCQSLVSFDTLSHVAMLEINISCPNTHGGEPFTSPERLEVLLRAVDELGLTKPVVVKMPISLPLKQFDSLMEVIARHNVQGVAIGNLLKDRSKATLHDKLPDSVRGNISGEPNRDISTELVRRVYKAYGDRLVIIGIGGIMSAEDAYEKICAGASLVALITGLIYEGPQLVGDINEGLVRLLERDGFTSVAKAIGTSTI